MHWDMNFNNANPSKVYYNKIMLEHANINFLSVACKVR